LEKLFSLHKHTDFSVRHFSGTASYINNFQLPEKAVQPSQRVMLDLGRVEVIAEVTLNGRLLGTLWKEPYRMDITNALITGTNKLEISVTNLWPNRMVGDAYLPNENDYDEDDLIKKFPEWYIHNQAKPGQRITFSSWNNFKKTDPLLESGLLGPVRLLFGEERILE
jgi:hypothetical protein